MLVITTEILPSYCYLRNYIDSCFPYLSMWICVLNLRDSWWSNTSSVFNFWVLTISRKDIEHVWTKILNMKSLISLWIERIVCQIKKILEFCAINTSGNIDVGASITGNIIQYSVHKYRHEEYDDALVPYKSRAIWSKIRCKNKQS